MTALIGATAIFIGAHGTGTKRAPAKRILALRE
jgi:hypothetical protein